MRPGAAVLALASILLSSAACDKTEATLAARALDRAATTTGMPSFPVACGPHGLPPDRHYVAEGLCARVVADGQGAVRGLSFAPNGDLFAVTADGEVRRHRDVDHDGLYAKEPPETIVWAKIAGGAHGCRFDGQDLYCAASTAVRRWRWSERADEGGAGDDVVVGLPPVERDAPRSLGVANDALYVGGAHDETRRFPLARLTKPASWKSGEPVAPDALSRSALGLGPASAIVLAPPGDASLPSRWGGGAFVALHGTSRGGASTGCRVAWVAPGAATHEIVFGGGKYGAPRDGEWSWHVGDASDDPVRPSALAIGPDGALYVASDAGKAPGATSGAVYRIALLGR
jgi:glucose/arabinose dehydrogenase